MCVAFGLIWLQYYKKVVILIILTPFLYKTFNFVIILLRFLIYKAWVQ